jgi:hypothetical protein
LIDYYPAGRNRASKINHESRREKVRKGEREEERGKEGAGKQTKIP